jgi:hypothetical protein
MTEREQQIAELLNEGWTREEAERQVLDDDLWIIRPSLRYAPESEADIEEWEAAAAQMEVFEQAAARGGCLRTMPWTSSSWMPQSGQGKSCIVAGNA